MSRNTTQDTRNFTIFFLNMYKKLIPECVSYNNNIVWSRDGNETARINYNISTLAGDSFIELNYKVKRYGEEDWKSIQQKIQLETVGCHFGGKRWYFRCTLFRNGEYCGRRVAVLYQAGDYFGCRHCANLTYDSCLQGKKMRVFPWSVLMSEWKADDLYAKVKTRYYKGKPTRKYKRCLKLWHGGPEGTNAEEQLFNSYT